MINKNYRVEIPVYDTIIINIDAKSKDDAIKKAIKKAIDTIPVVFWEIDNNLDIEVNEN